MCRDVAGATGLAANTQEGTMTPHDEKMRPLGELETAIMVVIWAHRGDTVRAVRAHLGRTPLPGYTTVATIMNRLVAKGLLQRARSGKVDVYRPVYGRE